MQTIKNQNIMNKLREKLRMYIELYNSVDSSEKCEQITDYFSVKFLEWKEENTFSLHTNQHKIFKSHEIYTTTELLQIFKEKYYE